MGLTARGLGGEPDIARPKTYWTSPAPLLLVPKEGEYGGKGEGEGGSEEPVVRGEGEIASRDGTESV